MSDAILGATIGAAATLAATIITVYRDNLVSLFRHRTRELQGRWKGRITERMLPASKKIWQEADIQIDLNQSGRRLSGKLHATTNHNRSYVMNVRGRMEDRHFITLEVRATSSQEFNFGVFVLEVDHKATTLSGYALANGFETHGVSLVTAELEKVS